MKIPTLNRIYQLRAGIHRLTETLTIRQLKHHEVGRVAELANKEGWNTSPRYLQCCYQLEPQGWWAAVLNNKVIGSCALVSWDDNAKRARGAFLIVEKSCRQKRIGEKLLSSALKNHFSKNLLTAALDPSLYAKKSFVSSYEFKPWKIKCQDRILSADNAFPFQIVPLKSVPLGKVEAYNAKINPWYSPSFFNKVIVGCSSFAMVAIDDKTDDVIGYGCLREAPDAWLMQPLYADNDDVVRKLLEGLLAEPSGEEKVIAYPYCENSAASRVLMQTGFSEQDTRLVTMFNREAPHFSIDMVYSTSSVDFVLA